MTKGEKIKDLRKTLGMSQVELAKRIGVSKQTLYKYENNIITNIPSDKIELLSNALQTTPADIMGWEFPQITTKDVEQSLKNSISNIRRITKIPLLGSAPCGKPNLTFDDYRYAEFIDFSHYKHKDEYYALRATGDSMYPKIEDGDIMIVHYQQDVENGQVAIVRVNGDEATCKKIRKYKHGLELIPINTTYERIFYTSEEVKNLPVEIIGRVVEARTML